MRAGAKASKIAFPPTQGTVAASLHHLNDCNTTRYTHTGKRKQQVHEPTVGGVRDTLTTVAFALPHFAEFAKIICALSTVGYKVERVVAKVAEKGKFSSDLTRTRR